MQEDLENISASELRWLLIKAIRHFIVRLGNCSTDELTEMTQYSKHILTLLKEKENIEKVKTDWVNNSTQFVEKSPQPMHLRLMK
jgi:hypothetical protein